MWYESIDSSGAVRSCLAMQNVYSVNLYLLVGKILCVEKNCCKDNVDDLGPPWYIIFFRDMGKSKTNIDIDIDIEQDIDNGKTGA